MQFLTDTIRQYFDKMESGDTIELAKTKGPFQTMWAAKEYNDEGHGELELSNDFEKLIKL